MSFSYLWRPLRACLRSVAHFLPKLAVRPALRKLPKIFVVVEGKNDIEFLRRIGTMLHAHDPRVPNLVHMEQRGTLVFMPSGGSDSRSWAHRLAGFGMFEFHLYDRDVSPATEVRLQTVNIVNSRPRCRAVLSSRRAMENYLHPSAIFEASGLHVHFSADDSVAEIVARKQHEHTAANASWDSLLARTRKRWRDKAKAWLNSTAVDRMTIERLDEADPDGEVRSWLSMIAKLARDVD